MERLLSLMGAFSVLLIAVVLGSLRRAHIRVEYSVTWLGAAIAMLLLSQANGPLHWIGSLLGISHPPTALLFILLAVFLFGFYRFSLIVSDLKDSNIALTQRVAILEYELRSAARQRDE